MFDEYVCGGELHLLNSSRQDFVFFYGVIMDVITLLRNVSVSVNH